MVLTEALANDMLLTAQECAAHPGVIDVRYYPPSIPYRARVAIIVKPEPKVFTAFSNSYLHGTLFTRTCEPYYRAYIPTDGALFGYAYYSLFTGTCVLGEPDKMGR